MPFRLFPFLIGLLLAMPAAAAPRWHIVDPWPAPETAHGARVEAVSFLSSNAFTPAALLHGKPDPAIAVATLYLPRDARPDHGTPAVVFLHGAAGMIGARSEVYGQQLAAMGIAALTIDTFGARTELATSFIGRVLHITETMFVADGYAGLHFLASRPEIDPHRVVLAGFSWGGMATIYALYAQFAGPLGKGLRFAGHVAFYAPCIARFADSRTSGAPLLMLYGDADELIRPDRCAEIAGDLRAGGSAVENISYPGAVHQWDGAMSRRLIGRNLSACRFKVEPDGAAWDERTYLPMTGLITRTIILALCVSSQPFPIGRDDAVRALSNRDFGTFLARVFAEP
jgi:dienelactone hydrolase